MQASRRMPIEVDDLFQEGMIAVMRAVPLFDPARSSELTYFGNRVRFAFRDFARQLQPIGARRNPHAPQTWQGSSIVCNDEDDRPLTIDQLVPAADGPDMVELRDEVEKLLRRCHAGRRRYLEMYFLEGLSMREVGERLGVGESRVSQIVTQEVAWLRKVVERRAESPESRDESREPERECNDDLRSL